MRVQPNPADWHCVTCDDVIPTGECPKPKCKEFLAAARKRMGVFVQPEGECTHCGTKHDDLKTVTVAGGGVVLEEKLCPSCREALGGADDFIQL